MSAATETPERLMTVRAVADLFGTSPKYVYARIKAGDLPVVELGTGYRAKQRVPESAVTAFIKARTYGPRSHQSPAGDCQAIPA